MRWPSGFGFAARQADEQAAGNPRLRHRLAFDNLDPRRPLHRAEVLGRRLDFFLGHRFRDAQSSRWCCPSSGRRSCACRCGNRHLLNEIRHGESGHRRIFRAPFPVRIVAQRARADVAVFAPARHDLGHRRVIAGMPVGRPEAVADLRQRELACAPRQRFRRSVVLRGRLWRAEVWSPARHTHTPSEAGWPARRARQRLRLLSCGLRLLLRDD